MKISEPSSEIYHHFSLYTNTQKNCPKAVLLCI